MCKFAGVSVKAAMLSLILSLALPIPVTTAQELPAPPDVGTAVLEDPLTGPGAVTASSCPTQRNARLFTDEGYLLRVTGKCTDTATSAGVSRRLDGWTVPDGEIRLDMKAVSGLDRVLFRLWFRDQGPGNNSYAIAIRPGAGLAQIVLFANSQTTVLAQRANLGELAALDDWNTLAVRTQGPMLWVLLNDQPLLSVADATLDAGGIVLDLNRLGDLNDDAETGMVLRNLRISALAGGDLARAPSYEAPQAAAPAPASAPPAAAPSGDPWIGDIAFGYDPSGAGAVPSGSHVPEIVGTLYGFVTYRNIPPGSKIGVQVLWGQETYNSFDFSPSSSQGRSHIGIVRLLGGDGEGRYVNTAYSLVITLNGSEVARGGIQVG